MQESLFTRTKLIIILTILLICAFTFTSIYSYTVTKKSLSLNAKTETLPLISDNIYSKIQQDLIGPINNSSLMAHDEFLIDWVQQGENNPAEIKNYLRRIKDEYHYFSAFFVSDITGNYYFYDGILKKISPTDPHDIWYYQFVESGDQYDLDVDTDEATRGTLTIFINHRLEDRQGRFLGVTGVGLEMMTMGNILNEYRNQFGHLIYMIDSNGLIQVHPDPDVVEKQYIQNLPGTGSISKDLLNQKAGTTVYENTTANHDFVISSRYFPDLDWFLIIEQTQSQSLRSAKYSLAGNIIIGILITALVIGLVILTINNFHVRLESLATRDELTGLYNRRKFQELFQHEIAISERYDHPISLLLLDIDKFKYVNDTFGHAVGDHLLAKIARVLQQEVRDVDIAGRWGGEEFVVLLPRADQTCAWVVAERLRQRIANLSIDLNSNQLNRTISIGLASAEPGNIDMEEMLKCADQAMYRAKQQGRNRTCCAPDKAAYADDDLPN